MTPLFTLHLCPLHAIARQWVLSYASHLVKRPPLLVLSDLHLGPAAPPGADSALAAVLDRYGSRELICLGDLFDLSAETCQRVDGAVIAGKLASYPTLARALRRHLAQGSPVTLVAGNHDAELVFPDVRTHLLRSLDLSGDCPLRIEPWWVHRAGMHLEHGHVWDPDNAPIHPLAPIERRHEPLGVALTRQVLAPTGAFQFAHAHQTTPLSGLLWALRELGVRAPELILRYFAAGARLFWAAASDNPARLHRIGRLAIEEFAKDRELSPQVIATLESSRSRPRHAEASAVFARLYLDRALATVVAASSLTLGLVEKETSFLLLAAAGVLYLALSKGDRAERYSASLVERVRGAALDMLPLVGAQVIVFGHTHVTEAVPGYVNTGTFGFPGSEGRPFLLCNSDGSIQRGYLDAQSNSRLEQLPETTRIT